MKELAEKYMDALEKLDWSVRGYYEDSNGETHVEIENWSPAGEDLPIDLHTENFPDSVAEYAACFDVDEHVELRIEGRGKRGVPGTARELVEDAEAIDKMLRDLADALRERESEELYIVYRCPDGSILLDWNETTWKHGYPAFRKDRCKELERGYCKGGPGLAHFYAELKKKYKEEQ